MTTTLANSPGKSNIHQHSENVCSNHIIIDKKFESLQKIFEIGSMKGAPTTVMNISAKFVSDNWKVRLRRSKTWRSFTTRSSSKLILIYNQTLCINRLCSLQKDSNYHRLNKNVLLKGVILRLLFKMKWRRCALLSMVQNLKKLSKEYDLLLPTIHCLINWHLQYIGTFTCFTWIRKSKCFYSRQVHIQNFFGRPVHTLNPQRHHGWQWAGKFCVSRRTKNACTSWPCMFLDFLVKHFPNYLVYITKHYYSWIIFKKFIYSNKKFVCL